VNLEEVVNFPLESLLSKIKEEDSDMLSSQVEKVKMQDHEKGMTDLN
jgi:hypothetical protein